MRSCQAFHSSERKQTQAKRKRPGKGLAFSRTSETTGFSWRWRVEQMTPVQPEILGGLYWFGK